MRSPVLVHVAWILVAVVAFVVGTFVSDPPCANSPAGAGQIVPPRQESPAPAITAGGFASLSPKNGAGIALNTEQARARTFEILSEPNRIKRMSQLSELLEGMSRENWKEVLEAFVRQTIHDGRTHDQEWFLTLERVGEIAGSEALADALNPSSPNMDRARSFLAGWAGSAPEPALEWFHSQAPELQKQLLQPLIFGVARSNPKQALELTIGQPQQFQDGAIAVIVDAALQRGGFSAAEELLRPLLGRADIEEGTRGKLFYNIARRRLNSARLNGNPIQALDWFGGYLGEGSPVGTAAMQEVIGSSAAANVEATMQWIDARSDQFDVERSAVAYGAVAKAWQSKAPEQFTAWVDAHPEHPQHDTMAAAAAASMLQMRRFEEAKRFGAIIRDERLRRKIENAVQQYGN